jgi:integrase
MVRQMLTDTAIKKAKRKARRYKLTDREGLYLAVMPTGKKVFRYEYRFHGRRETLTLGTYSETGKGLSLIEARSAHASARKMLEAGQSPAIAKRKAVEKAAAKIANSFKAVAEAYIAEFSPSRSASWQAQADRWLKRGACSIIGDIPLAEMERADVLRACKPALDRGAPYSAERTRAYIADVFSFAESLGLVDRNPARAARGAISVPASPEKPAMSAKELRDIITAIRDRGGRASTRIAFETLAYTFTRKSELTRARWEEVDLDAAEWRIPAARMKMREAHVVPLSRQAVELFKRAKALASKSEFVFPSMKTLAKPLSDTALNNGLQRVGIDKFSPHSFRRTASTMLNEMGWRADVIEKQLAHTERNKIRSTYNKATYLQERRQMMQVWADHLDAVVSGARIVPIKSRA